MKVPNRYLNAKLDKAIKLILKESWYLFGLPGTGKTYFTWAFRIARHNRLREKEKKQPNMTYDSLISKNWAIFCSELRYASFEARKFIIKKLLEVDMLIFDDIGSEVKTDFSDDILFQILDERYEWGKYTAFTSNHDIPELEYDGRIVSRIAGIVGQNKFEIKGNDRRINDQRQTN